MIGIIYENLKKHNLKKGVIIMKKFIGTVTVLGLAICSGSVACLAETPVLTSAANEYSVVVGENKIDFGKDTPFVSGKNVMLPIRSVAETLGFKVEWDGERQGVKLDNGEVNTVVYIGTDSYYMASSTAIGMSAPTALGSAPVLKNDRTYVPAEMFKILCGADAYTEKDNVITFKAENKTQIPNPFVEYKTIDEAKKALSFDAVCPTKIPEGYEIDSISVMNGEMLQIIYKGKNGEFTYRVAKGSDDISGDYNVYKDIKEVKVGDLNVTFRAGEKNCSAIWQNNGLTFSIFCDTAIFSEDIITNVQ